MRRDWQDPTTVPPKVPPARVGAQGLAGSGDGLPKGYPGLIKCASTGRFWRRFPQIFTRSFLVRRVWQVPANVPTKIPPARFGAQGLAGSGNGSDKGSLVRFGAQGLAGSGECSHKGVRFCA